MSRDSTLSEIASIIESADARPCGLTSCKSSFIPIRGNRTHSKTDKQNLVNSSS